MPEIPLQHCVPVPIFGPVLIACNVTLSFTVGGAAGAGSVDVGAAPGEMQSPMALPTGSSSPGVTIPEVTLLTLHYRKGPNGPDAVTVDATVKVVP